MKHVLIAFDVTGALETYLYGAGANLWNYYAKYGVWVSARELTTREVSDARNINGTQVVWPVSKIANGLS